MKFKRKEELNINFSKYVKDGKEDAEVTYG